MTKIAHFIFLLFTYTQLSAVENILAIDSNFTSTNSAQYIYYVNDKNTTLLPLEVLHSTNLQRASKIHLGGTTGPFWTKITLKNTSEEIYNLSLYNPLAGVNAIDVFIYKDNKLVKTHTLGDLRKQSDREVITRYSMFNLTLLANETVTIVSKIENYYIYNIGWHIQKYENFMQEENYKIFGLAFFGGLALLFSIFAFSLFKIYRQKEYLIVSLYFFSSLVYEYGFNGILYQLNVGLNLQLITALTWNSILISLLFVTLFAYYFFDFKNSYPKLAILTKVFISLLGIECIVTLYAQFVDESFFSFYSLFQYLALFIPLAFTVVGIYMFFKKESGAKYYLLGHGVLLFAIILNTLGIFSIITYHEVFKIVLPFAVMFDALFLLIAQYTRTNQKYLELSKHKELLIEQSRFISIGHAVGNITHQWKQPLSNIGSSITHLEAVLKHDSSSLEKVFSAKLPNIVKNIKQMQHTMDDFSNYYATTNKMETFYPKNILSKYVLEILNSKIILNHVDIKLNIEDDFELNCYEHVFSNIMMILIDNSLDSFASKGINNHITISIIEDKNHYTIDYMDNAGGIKINPTEKIFEYFSSAKENDTSKGHGIGLAIAKMLVEDKLNGTIHAKNREDGALFKIIFPINSFHNSQNTH
jgi:signal transduction histidine kinase